MNNFGRTVLPKRRSHWAHGGQAMVEFIVVCSTVLLALFILIPLFGKIFDVQFANQLASRYSLWERTVWFDSGDEPGESTLEYVATRSDTLVERSMHTRILNDRSPLLAISDNDLRAVGGNDTRWTYQQSGEALVDSHQLSRNSLEPAATPAASYDLLDTVNNGLTIITGPLRSILSLTGNNNQDFLTIAHETENYFSPIVSTQLNTDITRSGRNEVLGGIGQGGTTVESWVFQNWDGQLRYRGALLADGWNTQSLEHFRERVDDGVLSTALDNDPIDVIIDLVGTLEPSFSNLEFSWVGTDPIPDSDVECLSGAESAFGLCLFE